ncbi:MAG: hypothetical protein WA771_05200 [Chthoniobacterales bacterium]
MSRAKKKQPAELIRRWGEVWERWQWPDGAGGEPGWIESVEREPQPHGKPATLAVPARLVVAAPLWIDSVESEIVEESARLELDVRGLLVKRQAAGDAVLRVVDSVGERTLVLATVFPLALPESMPAALFDRYDASPFLRPLRSDALTVWREGDDLVAGFTRGSKVVYWESIGSTDDTREIAGWLNLACLQLRAEGVIDSQLEFVNELPGFKEGVLALPNGVVASAAPVEEEIKPSLANGIFRWRPPVAVAAAAAAVRSKQVRQLGLALAAIYCGIALIVGLYLGYQQFRTARMQSEAAALQAEVGEFAPISRAWRRVGVTAMPEFFPLEILHHVVNHLPEDGIRMTTFDVEDGRVLVEGEANPQRLTSSFFEAVDSDPELVAFSWNMPQPDLRADGSAKFEVRGNFNLPNLPR